MVSGERCRSAAASASARSTQATPVRVRHVPEFEHRHEHAAEHGDARIARRRKFALSRRHCQRVDARTGERLGQPGTSAPQLDLVRLDQRHPTELRIAARDQVRELACAGADVDEVIALAEGRQGQQKLAIVFGLALGARGEGRVMQVVPVRMLPRRFHCAPPGSAALFSTIPATAPNREPFVSDHHSVSARDVGEDSCPRWIRKRHGRFVRERDPDFDLAVPVQRDLSVVIVDRKKVSGLFRQAGVARQERCLSAESRCCSATALEDDHFPRAHWRSGLGEGVVSARIAATDQEDRYRWDDRAGMTHARIIARVLGRFGGPMQG